MMRLALIVAIILAVPASAQSIALSNDTRFQNLNLSGGETGVISTAPQSVQTLMFSPDETIRTVVLSDPGAYMIIVSGRGDSMSLRANSLTARALMTVRTTVKTYSISLEAGDVRSAPAVIRVSSSTMSMPANRTIEEISQQPGFSYRLSGRTALLPLHIRDDGLKTYLSWGGDQAMPAIFARSASGGEEMVDGYVRGGLFTLDHVYETLIFRIDHEQASAHRIEKRDDHGGR